MRVMLTTNGLSKMSLAFISPLKFYQVGKESLEELDSGNKTNFLTLFQNQALLIVYESIINSNCVLFRIAAERDLGRCTRDCGGKRTEQGYMNNTCDHRLDASKEFCFWFLGLGILFFFSSSSKFFRMYSLCLLEISNIKLWNMF